MQHHEEVRRRLCTHLGEAVLARTTPVSHSKWSHSAGLVPPKTPQLPYGDLWSLVNHIKVMHQYTELLSEAAAGRGPHAPLLSGKGMCAGALQWFMPLCGDITSSKPDSEYTKHMDIWRQANPGLFGDGEAAYHVHQSYMVEDRNMTRFLVSLIKPHAKEYEVDIAGNMLRARPASYDDFQQQFLSWRNSGLYHPLCLAARNMPRAEQWVPEQHLHEADDWQGLLDLLNRTSHCSGERLRAVCEALADRSPMLGNLICDMLDKVAILTRVKSNAGLDSPLLDDYMPQLQFPRNDKSPYTHCLMTWNKLRRTMETAVPPSLLCPTLYPPSRGAWGYRRLHLFMHGNGSLQIQPSPFTWMDKASLGPKEPIASPQERLYDILTRLGEAATSPEVAHLMLHPKSLHDILAGVGGRENRENLPDLSNRKYVIDRMMRGDTPDNADFLACLSKIVLSLPVTTERDLGTAQQFLAWRIDNPPRVILYHGQEDKVDLSTQPPYTLKKSIGQDKVQNRTVSGISMLDHPVLDPEAIHSALRACIAEEIVGAHLDFADHPYHKTPIRMFGQGNNSSNNNNKTQEIVHTTTLAEAVSLFTAPLPDKLSDVALHDSPPWTNDHIDTHYAERQTGDNGSRLRNWAAVYVDNEDIQRCRMASHEIRCSKVYETHFPLAANTGHSWVSVASSLPTETRVLKHLGGKSSLEVLKRSVDSRFMHDPKLLPVLNKDDSVLRSSMEIYTDEKAGQVLLAYAPLASDGERRTIEFMTFQLC